jgi:23S rRNA C2498 (ribose-2'-O)-methylase RlmM
VIQEAPIPQFRQVPLGLFRVNMTFEQAKRIVVDECLKPNGFAFSIRENRVDEQGFSRLLEAIGDISRSVDSEDRIDRLVVACLFELPWEIENTVHHYSRQSQELGGRVSKMAEKLREVINNLLWIGLESHYDTSSEELGSNDKH